MLQVQLTVYVLVTKEKDKTIVQVQKGRLEDCIALVS